MKRIAGKSFIFPCSLIIAKYLNCKHDYITTSSSCTALVEGKYTTKVVAGGGTYATFEKIEAGKTVLSASNTSVKDTYSIPNNPLFSDDPCQGMYIWRGVTVKNVPAFGNFIVVGQNPDKIAMYNNAAGNYDKLEFVRV